MRHKPVIIWPALVIAASLMVQQAGHSQHLYNKAMDDRAKAAKDLADKITLGAIFDTERANLEIFGAREKATLLTYIQSSLRGDINGLETWKDVDDTVTRRKEMRASIEDTGVYNDVAVGKAQAAAQSNLDSAKKSLEALQKQLAQLEKDKLPATLPGLQNLNLLQEYKNQVVQTFEEAKQDLAQPREQRAKKKTPGRAKSPEVLKAETAQQAAINRTAGASLDKIADAGKLLDTMYGRYAARINKILDNTEKLKELRKPLLQAAIDSLNAEEDHLRTVGLILARRAAENAALDELNDAYASLREDIRSFGIGDGDRIIDSLSVLAAKKEPESRKKLYSCIFTLHLAVALLAKMDTPSILADWRMDHEEELYSIRRSALRAQVYEQTVKTGVARLAIYHAGGIKPEQIALLIHTAATAALPPIILTK